MILFVFYLNEHAKQPADLFDRQAEILYMLMIFFFMSHCLCDDCDNSAGNSKSDSCSRPYRILYRIFYRYGLKPKK